MCPGACVTASGSLAAMIAVCGVTPHAQNTGTSGWSIVTASPQCGALSSAALMPRASGLPQWIGAPCAPARKRHGCVPHMRAEAVKKGQALPAEFSSYGAAAVAPTKQESQAWVYRDTGV